jgi:hypothetical protein
MDCFKPGSQLRLQPEPTNPADPDAIGVWDAALEQQLGYVPAALAPEIGERLRRGAVGSVASVWQWRDAWSGERVGVHMVVARHHELFWGDRD